MKKLIDFFRGFFDAKFKEKKKRGHKTGDVRPKIDVSRYKRVGELNGYSVWRPI